MDDLEQQLKEIREDLDQKYLKYLEFKKQLQQNESTSNTIDWEMEKMNDDIYNDMQNDIHVMLETKNNTTVPPLAGLTFSKPPLAGLAWLNMDEHSFLPRPHQTETKIPIIKETYYDRYNKKNILKIPRKSISQIYQ